MPDTALVEVAVDCPGFDAFTYRLPEALAADGVVGTCVSVPFGPRRLRGFIVGPGSAVPSIKDILAVHPEVRLPLHLVELARWGAGYYRCGLGEFLAGVVPAPVRQGVAIKAQRSLVRNPAFTGHAELTAKRRAALDALGDAPATITEAMERAAAGRPVIQALIDAGALVLSEDRGVQEIRLAAREERFPLTAEQQIAVDAVAPCIDGRRHQGFLLYGVTGSGKTLVYLELIERCLALGRQALLLLPEIALTPQLGARVRSRIPQAVVWHSGFTGGERSELWRQVQSGGCPLVVGTRSALFAPLPDPGLIIIDEEHEHSYKQDSIPRYHARDLAQVLARRQSIPVVLGSATPSLETIANARPAGDRPAKLQVITLRNRPLGGSLPRPVVVDMREESKVQGRPAVISGELVGRLRSCKAAGEQAIILLNRRGWSPILSCRSCGHTMQCRSCDIALTWHKGVGTLKCHYCASTVPVPTACPACGQATMSAQGVGTEQLAALVQQAVPGMSVLRVDADTVERRQGHARMFQSFAEGAADCLVGTQMVAKGLDFPRVTLVGVVGADRALSMPDFRAAERTWQLVAQVAGRAGRGSRPGTVVIQAYDPAAPPIAAAVSGQPRDFVDGELQLRKDYGYPPHAGLVRFTWTGPDAAQVQLAAQADGAVITAAAGTTHVVLGPTTAAIALIKDEHRWHCLVKSPSRGAAQHLLDAIDAAGLPRHRGVHRGVDVDPYQLG